MRCAWVTCLESLRWLRSGACRKSSWCSSSCSCVFTRRGTGAPGRSFKFCTKTVVTVILSSLFNLTKQAPELPHRHWGTWSQFQILHKNTGNCNPFFTVQSDKTGTWTASQALEENSSLLMGLSALKHIIRVTGKGRCLHCATVSTLNATLCQQSWTTWFCLLRISLQN